MPLQDQQTAEAEQENIRFLRLAEANCLSPVWRKHTSDQAEKNAQALGDLAYAQGWPGQVFGLCLPVQTYADIRERTQPNWGPGHAWGICQGRVEGVSRRSRSGGISVGGN